MTRPGTKNAILRLHPVRIMLVATLLLALPAAAGDPYAGNRARVFAMYAAYRAEAFADAPDIAAGGLMDLMASRRVVLVDVRSPAEQAVSMLPGAITEEAYLADPGRLAGDLVVAYCTIGYRSGQLAASESAQGRHMLNIKAGLLGWVHEGGKVYDPEGRETKRIHVYGPDWDLPPAGYRAVW